MTEKTAALLNEPRRINERIAEKQAQVDVLMLQQLPSGIRYDLDRVQVSPKDMMPDFISELDELETEIRALKADLAIAKQAIADACDKAGLDSIEKIVIIYRHSGRQYFSKIAESIHYSVRQTQRFHDDGVDKLDKMSCNVM